MGSFMILPVMGHMRCSGVACIGICRISFTMSSVRRAWSASPSLSKVFSPCSWFSSNIPSDTDGVMTLSGTCLLIDVVASAAIDGGT